MKNGGGASAPPFSCEVHNGCLLPSDRKAEGGEDEIGAAFGDHQSADFGIALGQRDHGKIEHKTQCDRDRRGKGGCSRREKHPELSRRYRAEGDERDVAQKGQSRTPYSLHFA